MGPHATAGHGQVRANFQNNFGFMVLESTLQYVHTIRYAVYRTHFSDMFQSLEYPRLKGCSMQLLMGIPRDGDSSDVWIFGGNNAGAAIIGFSAAPAASVDSNLISIWPRDESSSVPSSMVG